MKYILTEDVPAVGKAGMILSEETNGYFDVNEAGHPPYKVNLVTGYLLRKLGVLEEYDGKWKPAQGQRYWTVYGDGDVYNPFWDNDSGDKFRLATNNVFKTREKALKHREDMLGGKVV